MSNKIDENYNEVIDDFCDELKGILQKSNNINDNSINANETWSSNKINEELEKVFQSVSNGKTLLASAITDKGITTLATDSFEVMANNIGLISGGSVENIVGSIDDENNISLTGLESGTYTLKYEDGSGVLSDYDSITVEV